MNYNPGIQYSSASFNDIDFLKAEVAALRHAELRYLAKIDEYASEIDHLNRIIRDLSANTAAGVNP